MCMDRLMHVECKITYIYVDGASAADNFVSVPLPPAVRHGHIPHQ